MFIYDIDDELSLRMLNIKNAPHLFELIDQSRDYLRQWLPWIDMTKSVDDCIVFVKNGFQNHAERTSLTAGIFYKNKLVGIVAYNYYDWINRIGHIGYWIGEKYQGLGIITKSVHALIDYGFRTYLLNRIEIRCATENRKSQAIPERLGFIQEGKIRQAEWLYDHYIDHIIYGMLKEDWVLDN